MVNFQRKVRVNSPIMVKQLALDDFGIAMLSNSACKTELANGQLVPILQEWPIEPFKVYGVYSSRRQLATNISAFLDFFVKRFSSQESLQSWWARHFIAAAFTFTDIAIPLYTSQCWVTMTI